jgi:hypothetical protein
LQVLSMTEPPEAASGAAPAAPGAESAHGAGGGAAAAWPAGTAPAVPMPFTVLLDEAMRWTRRWLRALYLPFVVPVVVITAGHAVLQALWLGSDTSSAAADPARLIARSCSVALIALPVLLAMMVLNWAVRAAAVDAVAGRQVSFFRSLRFVLRPGVLGAQLLVLLCMVAAGSVCAAPALFGLVLVARLGAPAAQLLGLLCLVAAIVCFAVPALYVWLLLGLTVQAMAGEGVTGAAALRRSAELIRHNPRGRWLTSPIVKILALTVVVAVISYLVAMVVQLPVVIAQGVEALRKVAAGEDMQAWQAGHLWLQVPLSCLAALVTCAVSIYSGFAYALLFFDLRARREGDDLRRAIADMTAAAGELP